MDVSVVLKNVAMTTGEGPHWDDRCQSLYHVDINRGDVHKWDSITGEDTKVHIGKCNRKLHIGKCYTKLYIRKHW